MPELKNHRWTFLLTVIVVFLASPTCGQGPAVWQDPSKHQVRFVEVEKGVRLDVLDWGGSGRVIVLLAGSGNTAHVFDNFASKLIDSGHVYGVTRRGYGASSQPASGYDDPTADVDWAEEDPQATR
jgi:hypothetical protein